MFFTSWQAETFVAPHRRLLLSQIGSTFPAIVMSEWSSTKPRLWARLMAECEDTAESQCSVDVSEEAEGPAKENDGKKANINVGDNNDDREKDKAAAACCDPVVPAEAENKNVAVDNRCTVNRTDSIRQSKRPKRMKL
jgi:hypothetical protein